jgi:small subunit ribosomal protein S13
MARIEGVLLPDNKRVEFSLTYLFGIGLTRSREILKETGVKPDTRMKDLSRDEVAIIQRYISQKYKVEGELRKEITLNIKRLQEIGSYRGTRHKRSLPVRGQRTKTNARTRKGPRKAGSVVANKKLATKK